LITAVWALLWWLINKWCTYLPYRCISMCARMTCILLLLRLTCTVFMYICTFIYIALCVLYRYKSGNARTSKQDKNFFCQILLFSFDTRPGGTRSIARSSIAFWQFELPIFQIVESHTTLPSHTIIPFWTALIFFFPATRNVNERDRLSRVSIAYLFIKI
jgi:hypothetical protein